VVELARRIRDVPSSQWSSVVDRGLVLQREHVEGSKDDLEPRG
jgi:hypothetical protein